MTKLSIRTRRHSQLVPPDHCDCLYSHFITSLGAHSSPRVLATAAVSIRIPGCHDHGNLSIFRATTVSLPFFPCPSFLLLPPPCATSLLAHKCRVTKPSACPGASTFPRLGPSWWKAPCAQPAIGTLTSYLKLRFSFPALLASTQSMKLKSEGMAGKGGKKT